jgi:hypothetical protein
VPTVLRRADQTCPVCRCAARRAPLYSRCARHTRAPVALVSRASAMLDRNTHYHVYMPAMDGTLRSLLSTVNVTLEQRMRIFVDIARSIHNLAMHDIVNPDMKTANVLYRKVQHKHMFAMCDAGGLRVVGEPCVATATTERRYLVRSTEGRRFVSSLSPSTERAEARVVHRAVATHVNIYLVAHGIQSNLDLAEATHLTNQFSMLAMFMELVFISPPTYNLAIDKETWDRTHRTFPTVEKYLDVHMGPRLRAHPGCASIRAVVEEVWVASSDWKLIGTKHTYVSNMINYVEVLLAKLLLA